MDMKLVFAAATAALVGLAALPAAAQIGNPSFEPVAADAWTAAGMGSVAYVTSVQPAFDTALAPTDGTQFALLTGGGDDAYETLTQTFTLTKASTIGFDAAFLAFDETSDGLGSDDDGFVSIGLDGAVGPKLFTSDVDTVGDFGNTPWTHVHILLGPGVYTIEAAVRNVGDDNHGGYTPGFDSQLAVDNFTVTPVPEPQSWALLIAGFGGVGALVRSRRRGALSAA
jgi:PEP-CTERM motif